MLGAVLGALLDVVKGPPLEVTDQAAPGLKALRRVSSAWGEVAGGGVSLAGGCFVQ